MKRGLGIVICLSLVLILSLSFVSAGWFSDFLGKITGKVVDECIDSDSGKDYYVKGTTTKGELSKIDDCMVYSGGGEPVDMVVEYYCGDDDSLSQINMSCAAGCEEGVCRNENTCTDSDGGINYDEQGNVKIFTIKFGGGSGRSHTEECVSDKTLRELHCGENETSVSDETPPYVDYECPGSCENGACVEGTNETVEEVNDTEIVDNESIDVISQEETIETEVIVNETEEEQIEIIGEEVEASCEGCELKDKCYLLGYRKSGKYCSDTSEFIEYKNHEKSCSNNFECKSNVCVSDECVSGRLIQNILNWFKRVFGRE